MFDLKPIHLPSIVSEVFPLDYLLPSHLEARQPPEARGMERDGVRMLVSSSRSDTSAVDVFSNLGHLLAPGDLLVVNDSATLPAAVQARTASGGPVTVHLSAFDASRCVAEPRQYRASVGEILQVEHGTLQLLHPLSNRLWNAVFTVPGTLLSWLAVHGRPIRYDYVADAWPLDMYQTVFARRPGSAEMPSAGRPFTPRVLADLQAHGIDWAPITLHTGLSSPETHEPPQAEWYEVRASTVERIGQATGRVIAVGTTVVRALESASIGGSLRPNRGWTDLVVGPWHAHLVADGLLTGLHEPRATHLAMLEAFASVRHLRHAYAAALESGLLWHEFGDVHLLLP